MSIFIKEIIIEIVVGSFASNVVTFLFGSTWILIILNTITGFLGHDIQFIIAFLLLIQLIVLTRIFYLRDTEIDSSFFSIDRVRSIRFAFVYFITLIFAIAALTFASPFLVAIGIALIIALVITAINVFALVANLLLLLVGGFIGYLGYDFAVEVPNLLFEIFSQVADETFVQTILIILLIFIPVFFASMLLGKYVEDVMTGKAVIFQSFTIISGLYFGFDLVENYYNQNPPNDGILPILLLMTIPLLSYGVMRGFYNEKEAKDDYELPDTPKLIKIILTIFALILAVITIMSLILIIPSLINLYSLNHPLMEIPFWYTPIMTLFHGISALFTVMMIFWIHHGDFPVEIRIFEIEYREELLEKAREFREME